jgi:hypothetical protein
LEKHDEIYTFPDTSEGTLALFVEWIYRGGYPDPAINTPAKQAVSSGVRGEETLTGVEATAAAGYHLKGLDHPLLAYLRLYIFSEVYIIPGLKQHTFDRLTAAIKRMGKLQTPVDCVAVTSLLRLAFTKVPLDNSDKLHDWLAHYAAYSLDQLRFHPSFKAILKVTPDLSERMASKLCPTHNPPWTTEASSLFAPGNAKSFESPFGSGKTSK